MRHPFELKISDLEAVKLDAVRELTDEETKQISGGGSELVTTLALGEEGGHEPVTTLALGEEGGHEPVTTLALGEEGGYQRPPFATTRALGEEGGGFH